MQPLIAWNELLNNLVSLTVSNINLNILGKLIFVLASLKIG